MEQKDIQLNKGIHRAPSIEAQAGELSECVNLIPKNGELVNVKPPVADEYDITLRDSELLLCIHEVEGETHYITSYGDMFYYWEKGATSGTIIQQSSKYIKQVVAVGNALALIYEQSQLIPMKYLLWSGTEYTILSHKPTVKLDFKLTGTSHGKTYLDTFKIASVTSGSTSGGEYPDAIADIDINEYDITHELDGETTYKHTCFLTNNNLYSKKLRSVSSYKVTNKTGPDIHITAQTVTGTGTSDFINNESAWISQNEYLVFEFTATTRLCILWYSETEKDTGPTLSFAGKIATDTDGVELEVSKDDEGDSFNAMMGDLKDFINVFGYEKNGFIFPFYLRYGLKHFDGSISDLSCPLLFMPNTDLVPKMILSGSTDGALVDATAVAFVADLNMKKSQVTGYSEWKDIITGIVVGVTSPIYYFNEGEEYSETLIQGKVKKEISEDTVIDKGIFEDESSNSSSLHSLYDYITSYKGESILTPPAFPESEYKNNFIKASVFRQIREYTWEELENLSGWTKLNTDEVDLKNLDTYPTISDSYNDSESLYPLGGFSYNNRLNIYNIKTLPTTPEMTASPILESGSSEQYRCIFYVSNNGKQSTVVSEWTTNKPYVRWIYYGNANAKKCRLCKNISGTYSYVDIPLKLHPWMNGAYAFVEDDELTWVAATSTEDYDPTIVTAKNLEYLSNQIYASNASNPFYFPVSGQSAIGTGRIKTVSTAAKALSEGQFGQFPLYAFTTDGIWALSVSDQGSYATSNPVNRDIVYDNADVCQIDDSVIYACSQGLKRLSGSESQIISTAIDGNNVDETSFLAGIDEEETLKVPDSNTMVNMLQNCKIMYDSAGGRRLHIYPVITINDSDTDDVKAAKALQQTKHYIYDIESGEWTTAIDEGTRMETIVPGYPYSIVQNSVDTSDTESVHKLMSYTNEEDNTTFRNGVLLTRAMEFGNPFVMKMLCDLKMIYSKNYTETTTDDEGTETRTTAKCKIAVFVSNDRVGWKRLKSLRKHAYKWYRFRIQTSMTDLDALTAVSCLIDTRRDNKLR